MTLFQGIGSNRVTASPTYRPGSSTTSTSANGSSSTNGLMASWHKSSRDLQAVMQQIADQVAELKNRANQLKPYTPGNSGSTSGSGTSGSGGSTSGSGSSSGTGSTTGSGSTSGTYNGGGSTGGSAMPRVTGTSDPSKPNQPLVRLLPADYADGKSAMSGADRPSPRAISNAVMSQTESTPNSKGLSDLFYVWGQFLDHDLDILPSNAAGSQEPAPIAVPKGDPTFDPNGTGTATIPFTRTKSVTDANGVRQQLNGITGLIDGSAVYGSSAEETAKLRANTGGRLATSEGNLLPTNAQGQFIAGDIRVNEQPSLASMQTIWMREHNRVADQLAAQYPSWTDQQIFDKARTIVTSEMQAVTYNEWLPELLGKDALPKYKGYDPSVNAQVSAEFATSAFRFGHSMVGGELELLDANGKVIPGGTFSIKDQFFKPETIKIGGPEAVMRGLAVSSAEELDQNVVSELRNFLFTGPSGGLDLAALNIQRGRDLGVPSYNDARQALGLPRITSFYDPAFRDGAGAELASVYTHPDQIDLWVGGLSEKPAGDALVGPTFKKILVDQFTRSRDGNPLYYENVLSGAELAAVRSTTLSQVIERNSTNVDIQDQAFRIPSAQQPSKPTTPANPPMAGNPSHPSNPTRPTTPSTPTTPSKPTYQANQNGSSGSNNNGNWPSIQWPSYSNVFSWGKSIKKSAYR